MLVPAHGNMLDSQCQAIVNTVNCLGVMGKGVALQVKRRFPEASKTYVKVAKAGELHPGDVLATRDSTDGEPRWVLHFATKGDWRKPSQLEWIRSGLKRLADLVRELEIRSIAIPPVGCGNGGLDWNIVRPLVVEAMEAVSEVRVELYEPTDEPMLIAVEPDPEPLNPLRALLIAAMARYNELEYELTQLEVQKLAYFLQLDGAPFRLRFEPHHYGPYADNLCRVIERLEGHWITGFTGDRRPNVPLRLRPGAQEQAARVLEPETALRGHLERVASLIRGWEFPYGMELLATVHWVMTHVPEAFESPDACEHAVRSWNNRKRELFQSEHVHKAWDHIRDQGWHGLVMTV